MLRLIAPSSCSALKSGIPLDAFLVCKPIGFCYFLQDLDAAGDEWTDSQVAKGLTCLGSRFT